MGLQMQPTCSSSAVASSISPSAQETAIFKTAYCPVIIVYVLVLGAKKKLEKINFKRVVYGHTLHEDGL